MTYHTHTIGSILEFPDSMEPGDIFVWDGEKFVSTPRAHKLHGQQHSDVDETGTPNDGDVLAWDSTKGKFALATSGAELLDDAALNDGMYWDGTGWVLDRRTKVVTVGFIQGNEYRRGDEVSDGSNLSESLVDGATEYPYVTPQGEPFFLYSGTIGTFVDSAKQVIFGTRAQYGINGYLVGYRINIVTGNEYDVYLVVDPLGAAQLNPVLSFTASTSGWQDFSISPTIVTSGSTIDLVAIVSQPDPTPTTWSGSWNYQKPNNQGDPGIGDITHANRDNSNIYINYIDDDAVDWEASLKALTVGDTITGAGVSWSIQLLTHNDSSGFTQISVAPASQGTPTGVQDFEFETVTATPITTARDPGYWAANPFPTGTVQGLYIADDIYSNIVPNDDANGVDLKVQQAYVPTQWLPKIVSSSGSSTGDSSLAGILGGVNGGYLTAELKTTSNGWEDILSMDIPSESGFVVEYYVASKRTDGYGYFSGRYGALWSRNGGVNTDTEKYYEHKTEPGLRVRTQDSGGTVTIQVDGKNNQDWDWKIVLFDRTIA